LPAVLVLVERADGAVRKPTLELLTLARRLGDPVALVLGPADDDTVATLGRYGAGTVYVVDAPELTDYLVVPHAEAVTEVARQVDPVCVLVTSGPDGKEIAARVAVALDSGIITDAVDIAPSDSGPVVTQSVFSGSWLADSTVTSGTPVVTVRPNSATPEEAPTTPTVQQADVAFSDLARTAKVTGTTAKESTGRPDLTDAAIVVAGGRGMGSPEVPGRPDRQDRGAAALPGQRHLGSHPAPSRHAGQQDDRGGQQGPQGADLRHRRLRCRR
jgi:electron transfer flavoprotein alpha subunit